MEASAAAREWHASSRKRVITQRSISWTGTKGAASGLSLDCCALSGVGEGRLLAVVASSALERRCRFRRRLLGAGERSGVGFGAGGGMGVKRCDALAAGTI